MRKILILFNIAVLILLISSCDGLLNPEPDTHTTQIKYHKVLKDQEHSVIMPLKVGNEWGYSITKFREDGSISSVGSNEILVIGDTLINGDKWFFVHDQSYFFAGYLYTNTDVGLWSYSNCPCGKLRAEYPLLYSSYLLNIDKEQADYRDSAGMTTKRDMEFFTWIDVERLRDYSTIYGSFDCYKYHMWVENGWVGATNRTIYNIIIKEYFVPNLGLVRKELGYNAEDGSYKISELWELTSTNVKI